MRYTRRNILFRAYTTGPERPMWLKINLTASRHLVDRAATPEDAVLALVEKFPNVYTASHHREHGFMVEENDVLYGPYYVSERKPVSRWQVSA